jgi:hypothetical protein
MSFTNLIEQFKQEFENKNSVPITLRQGAQFNKYQNKIKKHVEAEPNLLTSFNDAVNNIKEGFSLNDYVSGIQENQAASQSTKEQGQQFLQQNKSDQNELADLESQFGTLMLQYEQTQQAITEKSKNYVDRFNSNNPYLNKNVRLANGAIGYVTNQGEYKWYSSPELMKSTSGKNGCPAEAQVIQVNVSSDNYNNPGSFLPTTPPLLVGSAMTAEQACGNEGTNVYVNTLLTDPATSYVGCFGDKEDRAMGAPLASGQNIYNYDTCRTAAIESGNRYFAVQNFQTDSQLGQCVVSNDLTTAEKYGPGDNIQSIALWSSNTSTGSMATLKNTGKLVVVSAESNPIFSSPNPPAECSNGGNITLLNATWGDGCAGVSPNNAMDSLNKLMEQNVANRLNYSYVVGTDMSDPSVGCKKSFNIAYQCGNEIKTGHIDGEAQGQNFLLDCRTESAACNFYLILQDDGNMCIYKGTPEQTIGGSVWCSKTNGQQQQANPEWTSAKGKKYPGKNYLSVGETLAAGEWIGSSNGALRLIMQTDGNLVLYTSKSSTMCNAGKDGKMYGAPWTNPIYDTTEVGITGNMGKLGYVDADSNLKEYPASMIGMGDTYQMFPNFDSPGNDLANMPKPNSNLQTCRQECTNSTDCHGAVFDTTSKNCWLKDKNVYPNSIKTPRENLLLLTRNPSIIGVESCNKDIKDIDSLQWSKYVNNGSKMTPDEKCGLVTEIAELKKLLDELKSKLAMLAEKITEKMEALQKENSNINNKMVTDQKQMSDNLITYKQINNELKNYKVASYQNINGMLTDTDTLVLQENYQYIFWSVLAIGLVIITMNNVRVK